MTHKGCCVVKPQLNQIQKPTDRDLHCLQRPGISACSVVKYGKMFGYLEYMWYEFSCVCNTINVYSAYSLTLVLLNK